MYHSFVTHTICTNTGILNRITFHRDPPPSPTPPMVYIRCRPIHTRAVASDSRNMSAKTIMQPNFDSRQDVSELEIAVNIFEIHRDRGILFKISLLYNSLQKRQ